MISDNNFDSEQLPVFATLPSRKKNKKATLVTNIDEIEKNNVDEKPTPEEQKTDLSFFIRKKSKKTNVKMLFLDGKTHIKEEKENDDIISIYRANKEQYSSRDANFRLFFDPKYLRGVVGGKKNIYNKIEEKAQIAGAFDLFNSHEADEINKEIEREQYLENIDQSIRELNESVNDTISKYVLYDDSNKSLPSGAVTFTKYKSDLTKYYSFASPSERGMMIVLMCFGGLINKSKFTGMIVKNAKNKLENVALLLSKFDEIGEESNLDSSLFHNAKKIISDELVTIPYKTSLALVKQIENLIKILESFLKMKDIITNKPLAIKFPIGYPHNHSGVNVVINGVPTYQDLINFYTNETGTSTPKANNDKSFTKQSKIKNIDDDRDHEYGISLSGRNGVGGSDRMLGRNTYKDNTNKTLYNK